MLNRSGDSGHPCLTPGFRGDGFSFSPLSMMLALGVQYIAFTMLRYFPFIPSFHRAFIMKWCWILLKAFSASTEMIKWFLSLLLLMCYITFIDLCILNHPCIPGDEANLVMVNNLFDVLLNLVYHYFIEYFYIDVQ
jgi:hypothetical protein